jgi:hypothetical protein
MFGVLSRWCHPNLCQVVKYLPDSIITLIIILGEPYVILRKRGFFFKKRDEEKQFNLKN